MLTYHLPMISSFHYLFDFRRANFTIISQFLLSYNWVDTLKSLDINYAAFALFDTLSASILRYVLGVNFTQSNFPA